MKLLTFSLTCIQAKQLIKLIVTAMPRMKFYLDPKFQRFLKGSAAFGLFWVF